MSKASESSMRSGKGESNKRLTGMKPNTLASDINIAITGSVPDLQWAEWNDKDINNERWGCKVIDSRKKHSIRYTTTSEFVLFEHEPVALPASLKVDEWRRPCAVSKGDDDFVLFVERDSLSAHELVSVNQHVIHSELIRSVLAAFTTVWHLGTHDSFPIEGESSSFTSNTKNLPWRPWHHIYSLCKAGRKNQHTPAVNPNGKYIIRLYFMGCWRKIEVDDKIPVDIDGKVLLPLTSEKNELWALLLTKAMLKLASLTWTSDKELVEFSPIMCLTGWIMQECDTKIMQVDDVWAMCNDFVKKFSFASEIENSEKVVDKLVENANNNDIVESTTDVLSDVKTYPQLNLPGNSTAIVDESTSKVLQRQKANSRMSRRTSMKGSVISSRKQSINSSTSKNSSRISNYTKSSNFQSRKGSPQSGSSRNKVGKKRTVVLDENLNTGPVLFAQLSEYWPVINFPPFFESPLTLGHLFLILQTRDTAFVCQKPRPGVSEWKRYRWIEWATKQGIFNPEMILPFRSVQIVSLFGDWFDQIDEKDNPDLPNNLSIEGIHASGDPGGSFLTSILLHTNLKDEQNEHNRPTSESSRHTWKEKHLKINDVGIANSKLSSNLKTGESKQSSLHVSNRSRLSYLETILSHSSMQYVKTVRDEEYAVPKCGASIWTDFNHISSSLDKIIVFYKPSGFRYKVNISNFSLNRETPVVRRRNLDDKDELVKSITIPFALQSSRNDGTYIHIDSIEKIKVLLVLSVLSRDYLKNSISGDVKTKQKSSGDETDAKRLIPHKQAPPVNVVVEVYNWANRHIHESETVLVIETFGKKSATLDLGKGRYILRFWIKTDTAFVLNVLSENKMIAGNRYKIENAMCTESVRLESFSQQMRNKLSYMIVTFGKPQFVNASHAVFQALDDVLTNQNKAYVHYVFMEAIVSTVKYFHKDGTNFDEYMLALRVLFLNVSLELEKKMNPLMEQQAAKVIGSFSEGESEEKQMINYDSYNGDDDEQTSQTMRLTEPSLESRYQQAAYRIQATWKRHCAMKLMNIYQNTQSKEHKQVVERLRKLNETLFTAAAFGDVILRILKTMLELEPDIAKWLPLYRDLGFIVKVDEWRGAVVNVTTNNMWIPVFRMVVLCHSDTPIVGAIDVTCQFSKYMVRVIDNDNLLEKPRQVFNVEPCTYSKNKNGYTVFVYAWSEIPQKEVRWKLQIVTLKNCPYIHSCSKQTKEETCTENKPPVLMTSENSNYYIPNRKHLMARLLIRIKKNMLVSFRLSSSFNGAMFTVCLQDKHGCPLLRAQAVAGAVIIPVALLERETDSLETMYIIEAKVIHDSWPLTRQEWMVQERVKNDYVPHKERTVVYMSTSRPSLSTVQSKKSDFLKRKTEEGQKKKKECRNEFQMESPYWMLQTVIDYSEREFIKVKQDTRKEDAVKAMKQVWEAADPGRANRGKELRNTFVMDAYGLEHDKASSAEKLQLSEMLFGKKPDSKTKIKQVEEECTERFLNPPEEFGIAQSKTHFFETIAKYFVGGGGTPVVKTREDHEREIVETRKREEEFLEEFHRDVGKRSRMVVEQRRKHRWMHDYYAKSRHEARLLVESAYEIRDNYVRVKIEEEQERKALESYLKKRGRRLKPKKTSKKGSRKSSPNKKTKKKAKSSPKKKDMKMKTRGASPKKKKKK